MPDPGDTRTGSRLMVWFRVDDTLPTHHRVLAAGNAAMGLWVRCGAWSMGQLTDGFIPAAAARMFGTQEEIDTLVRVGLWIQYDEGYQFHAWSEDGTGAKRQPTRAEVEAQRRADRDRKAAYRARREHPDTDVPPSVPTGVPLGHDAGHDAGQTPDATVAEQHPDPTRPDPTRPSKDQEIERPNGRFTDRTADAARPAPSASQEIALIEAPKPPAQARSTGYPAAFEDFWRTYPRHEGKRNALTAWQRACRRADPRRILEGAARYAADPNRDDAYTAHPTTWLNRDGWDDAPLPKRRPDSQQDRLEQNSRDTLATLARMGVA